ncbi:alpha/beta fold hydrolase [Granulicella sibirica]|uniref:alpha/beta fold hydrolase n=1 Tax=Granulicella sibirica TaxID=2479048 RepID=UPI001F4F8959|nr:alpha/beta fold hydrolase [Granulicella sibirica]
MTENFVVVDGVRVHFGKAGSGPALVLVHGLVGSVGNWRRNIVELAEDATVYAVDLTNMGRSERVKGLDASLAATADRLAAFMEALGLDKADISGHSHGGAVAMMFAARHPERVRSLILFAPANPFCDFGHFLVRFYQTRTGKALARMVPYLPKQLHALSLRRMYGDPLRVTDGSLEGYTDGLRVPGTMEHILRIVGSWFEDMRLLQGELERIAMTPTLLVWGDRDRAVGLRSAEFLQEILQRSRLVVVPGAGHIPFEEMPEECNRAVHGWLSGAVSA